MINKIRLKNVKAFIDTNDIELAPITIFVGQNSCGKSSIVRFPVVLKQTVDSSSDSIALFSSAPVSVDYGGFSDVVHNHSGLFFTVSISFSCPSGSIIPPTPSRAIKDEEPIETVSVEITYMKSYKENRIIIKEYKTFCNGKLWFVLENECNNSYFAKMYLFPQLTNQVDKELTFRINHVSFSSLAPILLDNIEEHFDMTAYSEEVNPYGVLQAWCIELHARIEHELSQIDYIGPFRTAPERIYRRDMSRRSVNIGVGNKGEQFSNVLINNYFEDNSILEKVSEWCQKILKCNLTVEQISDEYYQICLTKDNQQNNIIDSGYGISQVLPIITQIVLSMYKSKAYLEDVKKRYESIMGVEHIEEIEKELYDLLIIEQPELHLHPSAQTKLAHLVAAAVEKGYGNHSFIIETHSEHFIRALQVMIADNTCQLTNDMVKIYYIDHDINNNSVVSEMPINKYGQLKQRWPKGFFDEALTMTDMLIDAIAERKMQKE